jgi:hypothetical protein
MARATLPTLTNLHNCQRESCCQSKKMGINESGRTQCGAEWAHVGVLGVLVAVARMKCRQKLGHGLWPRRVDVTASSLHDPSVPPTTCVRHSMW